MHPTPTERDALFEDFARALFKHDMDALYRVVSPDFVWCYHDGVSPEVVLIGPDAILKHLDEKKTVYATCRFHEVVYHVSETMCTTSEHREQRGIERYTFEGGKIATKEVYRKPVVPSRSHQGRIAAE